MADKSLYGRLKRLFSQNVIVRRIGKGKSYVIDTDHLQSSGNLKGNTSMQDRYTRMHGIKGNLSTYNQQYNYHSSRLELYSDYEAMDTDSIISSALDIYSDECTIQNDEGQTLRIVSSNENIRQILHNLFYDILNIEFNLWAWTRIMAKYGDFYLHLDIKDDIGIVNVNPLSSYEVYREEGYDPENPNAVRFINEGPMGKHVFENFEVAHFRLLGDANFLPYGKSMIEPARKTWKQLTLMEDAMLIHRIMRAPERRIFKVDIGNIPPAEVDQHMQQIIDKMKKVPYVDQKTGEYNLKFNMMNMLEDYYLPVRGGQSGTEIDTLNGMENNSIEDIEYLKNRMFAALKIPKAFLGYDENVEGKATLAAEDVRFARTIERIQRILISELSKIAIVHLFSQGFTDEDLIDFNLELTNPSIVYEQEKVDLLSQKMSLASDIKDLKMISDEWIYKNIFNMSKDEYESQQKKVLDDLKETFRKTQIEDEGNDPYVTNESFGTPHDLASMAMSKGQSNLEDQEVPDGGWPGAGRPENTTKYGTDKHPRGRDPLAKKDISKVFKRDKSIKHNHRGSALSAESVNIKSQFASNLIKGMQPKIKTKKIIKDSIDKSQKKGKKSSNLLDESQLINH